MRLRSPQRVLFWELTGLLLLALALWALVHFKVARPEPRRLVLAAAPATQWAGFTENQRHGFNTLLQDLLEADGDWVVAQADLLQGDPGPRTAVLDYVAERKGMGLAIHLRWREGGAQPRPLAPERSGDPRSVLLGLAQDLGLDASSLPRLLPEFAPRFWDLAELTGWKGDVDLEAGMALGRALCDAEPELASAWCAYADMGFRKLALDRLDVAAQQEVPRNFTRALELIPAYPRAVYRFAAIRTDSGDQRGALELIFATLKVRPNAVDLYGALAYAARTCGLLEAARLALEQRDALAGPLRFQADLVENTWLYAGEWIRFQESLGGDDSQHFKSMRDFYRGYIRLIQERRGEALPFFQRASASSQGAVSFEKLAGVYALALEGRREEARALLDEVRASRTRLSIPDGELTFKVAEAYAFLGAPDEAVEMAYRAFAQGFGCARWYQESPLLRGLQELPRFKALRLHLQRRQDLLAQRFPERRFMVR